MVPLVTNPKLLMLSPKLPKTHIPYVPPWGINGGGGVPTFDAEAKTTLTPNSLCPLWGGCKGGGSVPTFDAESKTA